MNVNLLLLLLGSVSICLLCEGCSHARTENASSRMALEQLNDREAQVKSTVSQEEIDEPEDIPFKPYERPSNLTELETCFYEILERYQIAGIQAAVVANNKVVWNGAYGWFDIHRGIPLKPEHNIRIASISKSFAGLAAMTLVQQGKLNLDEDINVYLDMPVAIRNPHHQEAPITARQLMNHTSSILNGQYVEYVVASRKQNPVTYTLVDYFGETGEFNKPGNWSKSAPGETFSYSNMGTVVLGAVIEKLSGQEFSQYVRDAVLKPLGIHNSSFNPMDINKDRIAKMYRRQEKEGQVSFAWTPVPAGISFENYIPGTNGGLFSPQGGLMSNAVDLAHFALAMTNYGKVGRKRILSRSAVEAMHEQSVLITTKEKAPGELYKRKGLCIHITDDLIPGYTFYGHSGNAYGIISRMYYTMDLPENFGFVLIFNGCNISRQQQHPFYSIEEEIITLLYHQFI